MNIGLFTNWYKSYRDEENEACLAANLVNPNIKKIYLFCDDGKPIPVHKKIVGIKSIYRPTYNMFFTAVNKFSHEFSIIANSDIHFDESLEYLKYLDEETSFALTRWDDTSKGHVFYNRWDSQDAWIFKGPVKEVNACFESGRLGCDNRLAHELRQAGYRVFNPSKTIKAIHLHSEIRTENSNHDKSKTIPPPYEYILPMELVPFMSIVTRHYYKRPNMFKSCCESVKAQICNDYEHVIITDNEGIGSLGANGLFEKNKDLITGSYVFILDDDDLLTSNEFVGDIRKIVLEYNPKMIFVRMMINDELYPTEMNWKQSKLHQNHVGSFNVIIRKDIWKENIHNFSTIQTGDFQFINSVFKKLSPLEIYWQDKIYGRTGKVSHGAPE